MDTENIWTLTGSAVPYNYTSIGTKCSDDEIVGYFSTTRALFGEIANRFDDELHTEWAVRNYLALKMVLAATLLAASAEYAEEHNLGIAAPYLNYYTLINAARAFLFTLPCTTWKGTTSLGMTHRNIINTASDKLRRLSQNLSDKAKPLLRQAQMQRELFSYRFPASGFSIIGKPPVATSEAIDWAQIFAELAQANSACLEGASLKRNLGPFELLDSSNTWLAMTYDDDLALVDMEDWYRIGYIARKQKTPTTLVELATEGLLDDFFGSWCSETRGGFDPDSQKNLLLDFY